MSDKRIKFILKGQEIICNFGTNYFYKHFEEITGIDMLINGLQDLKGTAFFGTLAGLYCAGYFAECSLKKQDPIFTKSEFEDHVFSTDETGAAKMLTDYTDAIKTKIKPGELAAQTIELIPENL